MKIVVCTSPHLQHAKVVAKDFSPSGDITYSFAPVGLLSIISSVRKDLPNAEISLYDTNRMIRECEKPLDCGIYNLIATQLAALSPQVLGFMTECDSYHHVLAICDEAKRIIPNVYIVLGGPHASAVSTETLNKFEFIDAVVVGEAEVSFPRLLKSLELNSSIPVAGTVKRDGDGGLLIGQHIKQVSSLDDLPVPAYADYRPSDGEELFIEVGRGCPFDCSFCSTAPYWKRQHRVKSPQRILNEIQIVKDLFGSNRVHFTHDLFTTNRKWVESLCEALIVAGNPVRWTCSSRTDTVDANLLSLMAQSGCNAIYFGLESGNETVLQKIQKNIPVQLSLSVLRHCIENGIQANVGLIVGFPFETPKSIIDTFALAQQCMEIGCKPVHIFGYNPFVASTLGGAGTDACHTGHYVDLPFTEVDASLIRLKISNSKELFGSYYRHLQPQLETGIDCLIDGVDEFSPLLELSNVSVLELAKNLKHGLYDVYVHWLDWIIGKNEKRGASKFRRAYGSPSDFASFLACEFELLGDLFQRQAEHARFLKINLSTGSITNKQVWNFSVYRSHEVLNSPTILPSSEVTSARVLSLQEFTFDVSAVRHHADFSDLPPEPSFFVWHLNEDAIRLVKVNRSIYTLLSQTRESETRLDEHYLALDSTNNSADFLTFMADVQLAIDSGILLTKH